MQTEEHVTWHSLPIERPAETMTEALDAASDAVFDRQDMGDKDVSLTDYFHIVTAGLTGVLGDDMGVTLCTLAGSSDVNLPDQMTRRCHVYFQKAFLEVFDLLLSDYQAIRANVELPFLTPRHSDILLNIYGDVGPRG